ncbi:MAG: hypothetical protein M3R63_17690 [Actinomycetota bacterium]|nr:hypothetical protein [Actinomycetota bacterium]
MARLSGRPALPEGFGGRLDADEHVVSVAELARGGHLVLTQRGLWVPEGADARRVGWEWISKAVWDRGALLVTEAVADGDAGDAVVLRDLPPRRFVLADAGRVPEVVRERVTGSIRSSQHRELPGGGAWFVQRKVPGRDGVVLQVRPDPGTQSDAVRVVAAEVATRMRQARPQP